MDYEKQNYKIFIKCAFEIKKKCYMTRKDVQLLGHKYNRGIVHLPIFNSSSVK